MCNFWIICKIFWKTSVNISERFSKRIFKDIAGNMLRNVWRNLWTNFWKNPWEFSKIPWRNFRSFFYLLHQRFFLSRGKFIFSSFWDLTLLPKGAAFDLMSSTWLVHVLTIPPSPLYVKFLFSLEEIPKESQQESQHQSSLDLFFRSIIR